VSCPDDYDLSPFSRIPTTAQPQRQIASTLKSLGARRGRGLRHKRAGLRARRLR
jgi:hypothetical protein